MRWPGPLHHGRQHAQAPSCLVGRDRGDPARRPRRVRSDVRAGDRREAGQGRRRRRQRQLARHRDPPAHRQQARDRRQADRDRAGFHGFHIHSVGICDPRATDATGAVVPSPRPAVTSTPAAPPTATTPVTCPSCSSRPTARPVPPSRPTRPHSLTIFDADGAALIIHAGPDNLANIPTRYSAAGVAGPDAATLATGDSGGRFALRRHHQVGIPRTIPQPFPPTMTPPLHRGHGRREMVHAKSPCSAPAPRIERRLHRVPGAVMRVKPRLMRHGDLGEGIPWVRRQSAPARGRPLTPAYPVGS